MRNNNTAFVRSMKTVRGNTQTHILAHIHTYMCTRACALGQKPNEATDPLGVSTVAQGWLPATDIFTSLVTFVPCLCLVAFFFLNNEQV